MSESRLAGTAQRSTVSRRCPAACRNRRLSSTSVSQRRSAAASAGGSSGVTRMPGRSRSAP